jgi:hypothetical protein
VKKFGSLAHKVAISPFSALFHTNFTEKWSKIERKRQNFDGMWNQLKKVAMSKTRRFQR